MGMYIITSHAVERFQGRIAEGEIETFEEARGILVREIRRASPRSVSAVEMRLVSEDLGCEFVMVREQEVLVCVTVLEYEPNVFAESEFHLQQLDDVDDAHWVRRRSRSLLRRLEHH